MSREETEQQVQTEQTEKLHQIWRKPWWPAAKAVSEAGYDCTVMDPDAEEDEDLHTGKGDHGVVHVRTCCALGWTVLVQECEPDVEDDG